MTDQTTDNEEVITRARMLIENAERNSRVHAGDPVRLQGEYKFVIGYLQALLTEGLISHEICNQLIAELDSIFKTHLASVKKIIKKLKI